MPPMVFQWFLILLPSLSMVFDGYGPLVKRCDGFDGSLWSTRHPLVQSSFQCLHLQPNTAVCCFFGSRFPDLVCTRMPDPRCRISDLAQTGCHYLHFHIWPASQPFPKLTKFSIFTIYFRSKVTFENWSTQKPNLYAKNPPMIARSQ